MDKIEEETSTLEIIVKYVCLFAGAIEKAAEHVLDNNKKSN